MRFPSTADVVIVGAGVSGLTTGICLAELGISVRLLAKDPPAATTSAVAGASWGPYMTRDPRVLGWSLRTRDVFTPLAGDPTRTGVRFVAGMEASAVPTRPPDWVREDPTFRIEPNPPEGFVSAWHYTNPLVDMPVYLEYLQARLLATGATIEIGAIQSLHDLAGANLVINCTGLGARTLVDDPDLRPTRGQLVVVKNNDVDRFFQDTAEEGDLTYFLPHGDKVVLGGSAREGAEDVRVDHDIADAIVERCARIEPRLRDAVVIEHRVGLRPNRPNVRLERDDTLPFPVIHNYGHGGSGVTLSWGCANEVLDLVTTHLGR